ncbi:uncharacterized protein LOC111043154 isoform X2 [Myzus persicae]|uniref:uncharacterized protein LOC111043154 isoform X2 n=1 Tax=Myzus persicae TaxID=13164 RepID=UPI000B9319A7|nr:uncharacterized protein LOC111043154 isoform X2 [Myzus persicae]
MLCTVYFCVVDITEPVISDAIQLDNVRHLTRINSDLQRCLVPINVLNSMGYENITNNPLLEQTYQQSNAAHNFRTNIPTARSTIVPLSSELNYLELDASDVTSPSRPLMDDPPPSYDECTKNSSTYY